MNKLKNTFSKNIVQLKFFNTLDSYSSDLIYILKWIKKFMNL